MIWYSCRDGLYIVPATNDSIRRIILLLCSDVSIEDQSGLDGVCRARGLGDHHGIFWDDTQKKEKNISLLSNSTRWMLWRNKQIEREDTIFLHYLNLKS